MLKTAVQQELWPAWVHSWGWKDEQIEAIGKYFEGVGLAFQIMDDVLNLRGLYLAKRTNQSKRTRRQKLLKKYLHVMIKKRQRKRVVIVKTQRKKLKVLGEDIMAGKVTMPVAKASQNE